MGSDWSLRHMVTGSAQGCVSGCRRQGNWVWQITVDRLGYSCHLKRQYLLAQNKTDVAWQVRPGSQVAFCKLFRLSVGVTSLHRNLQMPYVTCYTSQVSSHSCSLSYACSCNFIFKVLKSCNRHFCDTYICLKAWAPKLFIYRLLDMLGSYFWNRHFPITFVTIVTHVQLTQLRFSALLCHPLLEDLRWWNQNGILQQGRTMSRGLALIRDRDL